MRATPFKWLLIGFMVMSFVGRPWAQTLAASPAHGCGDANAATMAMHAVGKIVTHQPAMVKNESGKPMLADCVKSCAAMPILGQASVVWSPEIWPQAHSSAVDVALHGHPPKPGLYPPIARV